MPRHPFDRKRLARYPKAMVDFVAALVEREETTRETDEQFAARLGVSVHLWRHTRDGRVPLGLKLWAAGADIAGYQLATAAHSALMERAKERWPERKEGSAA